MPRSSRNHCERVNGVLKLWVTAAPTDGQANEAVCAAIAKLAGVPPSKVAVKRGDTSRTKLLSVTGVSQEELDAKLAGL